MNSNTVPAIKRPLFIGILFINTREVQNMLGKLVANINRYVVKTIIGINIGIAIIKNGLNRPAITTVHIAKFNINQGIVTNLQMNVVFIGEVLPLKIEIIERTVSAIRRGNIRPFNPKKTLMRFINRLFWISGSIGKSNNPKIKTTYKGR
jgi:hypothetical protein